MSVDLVKQLLLYGFGTSLTIGFPLVLVGFAVKLMHMWK